MKHFVKKSVKNSCFIPWYAHRIMGEDSSPPVKWRQLKITEITKMSLSVRENWNKWAPDTKKRNVLPLGLGDSKTKWREAARPFEDPFPQFLVVISGVRSWFRLQLINVSFPLLWSCHKKSINFINFVFLPLVSC